MTANTSDVSPADTVVLIHGLWMTPRSWEQWVDRYSGLGYRVLAPAWPGMEGGVEELRRDPSPIARLGIRDIVAHYAGIIRDLDRPPIIMGHSFGGAFVLLLLDRGLGAAGVGIAAGPVRGVLGLPLATLRSAFPILRSPANRHRAVPITREQFRYAFGNTLSDDESDAAYERQHVPGAGRVLWEGALANANPRTSMRVDFDRARAPLLFLAGGKDHVVPASVNRSTAKHYHGSPAVTELHEFPARSHYTLAEPGWEEVADDALDWAVSRTSPRAMA